MDRRMSSFTVQDEKHLGRAPTQAFFTSGNSLNTRCIGDLEPFPSRRTRGSSEQTVAG